MTDCQPMSGCAVRITIMIGVSPDAPVCLRERCVSAQDYFAFTFNSIRK